MNSNIDHYRNTYPKEKYMENIVILNNKNSDKLLTFLKNYENSAWLGHLEFVMWLVNIFKPKTIVELGVDWAHSTFAFSSEGIGNVYGIDCFEGDMHSGSRNTLETVKETYKNLLDTKLLLNDNIHFIKGYFDDVAKTFNKQIDLLHIDGLHTYEAVKNDFEKWFPNTSEDSIILFHDIWAFRDSVGKFFDELDYPKTQVTHSAGLGILSRNKNIIDMIDDKWVSKLKEMDKTFLRHVSYNFTINKVF